MSREAPTIVQLAERVLVEIEQVVRQFPRYHKYAVGDDLRTDARTVVRLTHRAWRDSGARGEWLRSLVAGIDDLKMTLQIAKQVEAFRSFAQFEALARLITNLGRQCGGWQKKHLKGQNRQADSLPGRAQILSARAALSGANP